MEKRTIACSHRDLPTGKPVDFQKVKQLTILGVCKMKKQSARENIIDGVSSYRMAIKGKSEMSGIAFADECRKIWTEQNILNAYYYKLFEKHIISVKYDYNGQISLRYTICD